MKKGRKRNKQENKANTRAARYSLQAASLGRSSGFSAEAPHFRLPFCLLPLPIELQEERRWQGTEHRGRRKELQARVNVLQFLQLGSARLHLLLLPLTPLLKFQLCAGEAARLESTPVQALINYGRLGTKAEAGAGAVGGECVFLLQLVPACAGRCHSRHLEKVNTTNALLNNNNNTQRGQ